MYVVYKNKQRLRDAYNLGPGKVPGQSAFRQEFTLPQGVCAVLTQSAYFNLCYAAMISNHLLPGGSLAKLWFPGINVFL